MEDETGFNFNKEFISNKYAEFKNKDIRTVSIKSYQDIDMKIKNSFLLKLKLYMSNLNMNRKEIEFYLSLSNDLDQVRFMNMELLSQVFLFINKYGVVNNIKNINYKNIEEYINVFVLKRDLSEKETEKLKIKYIVSFFRYLRYIYSYMVSQQRN
jgi:hypothetical protein